LGTYTFDKKIVNIKLTLKIFLIKRIVVLLLHNQKQLFMNLIDQAVIGGFSGVDKIVEDNFSSVFSKEDVKEILKIAKYDMVTVLESADPDMFLNPDRIYVMKDLVTMVKE
jgi:hypothetical protein